MKISIIMKANIKNIINRLIVLSALSVMAAVPLYMLQNSYAVNNEAMDNPSEDEVQNEVNASVDNIEEGKNRFVKDINGNAIGMQDKEFADYFSGISRGEKIGNNVEVAILHHRSDGSVDLETVIKNEDKYYKKVVNIKRGPLHKPIERTEGSLEAADVNSHKNNLMHLRKEDARKKAIVNELMIKASSGVTPTELRDLQMRVMSDVTTLPSVSLRMQAELQFVSDAANAKTQEQLVNVKNQAREILGSNYFEPQMDAAYNKAIAPKKEAPLSASPNTPSNTVTVPQTSLDTVIGKFSKKTPGTPEVMRTKQSQRIIQRDTTIKPVQAPQSQQVVQNNKATNEAKAPQNQQSMRNGKAANKAKDNDKKNDSTE